MRKLLVSLSIIALGLFSFIATASAATAIVPEDGNLLDFSRPILDAALAGHYLAAFAFSLVLSVAAFKRYAGGKFGEYVRSDAGGVVMTFGMSFFGAVATSLLAFKGFAGLSLALFKPALLVGFLAIGGYVGVKKFLIPIIKRNQHRFPAWTGVGFTLLYFLFDKPDAVTVAEKAGADAVADKPATGTDGATGTTTTVI